MQGTDYICISFPTGSFSRNSLVCSNGSYLFVHKKRVRMRKPDLRFRCSLNGREYTTLSFQKSKGFLTDFWKESVMDFGEILRLKGYIAFDISGS